MEVSDLRVMLPFIGTGLLAFTVVITPTSSKSKVMIKNAVRFVFIVYTVYFFPLGDVIV